MNEFADDSQDPPPARTALLLTLWDDGEAEMIRQILLEHGIPSHAETDLSHALFPLSVDGLGEIRIVVQEDRLAEARELLAEHRREGLEIVVEDDDHPDNGA